MVMTIHIKILIINPPNINTKPDMLEKDIKVQIRTLMEEEIKVFLVKTKNLCKNERKTPQKKEIKINPSHPKLIYASV